MNCDNLRKLERVKLKNTYQIVEKFLEKGLVYMPELRMGMEEVFQHKINFCEDINCEDKGVKEIQ